MIIEELRIKTEDLLKLYDAYVAELGRAGTRYQELLVLEEHVRELEKGLDVKRDRLKKEAQDVHQERLYTDEQQLAAKTIQLRFQSKQADLDREIEKEEVRLAALREALEVREKKCQTLEVDLEKRAVDQLALHDREELVTKRARVDQERKRLLDLREKHIEAVERRLQIDATMV